MNKKDKERRSILLEAIYGDKTDNTAIHHDVEMQEHIKQQFAKTAVILEHVFNIDPSTFIEKAKKISLNESKQMTLDTYEGIEYDIALQLAEEQGDVDGDYVYKKYMTLVGQRDFSKMVLAFKREHLDDNSYLEKIYEDRRSKPKPPLVEFDLSRIYGENPQKEVNPDILDRVEGVNITSTRTRRHITIKAGIDQVTVPSPQFVYDVELSVKRVARDLSNLTTHVRRLDQENKRMRSEIDTLKREMARKMDYPG